MDKKEVTGKDLLLCFLYSPGLTPEINEPIIGRTKLTKMMYLFEKQIYGKFFKDDMKIEIPAFEPYYFGPFSKQLFDDLSFFESIGMIINKETNIPLSSADTIEFEKASDEYIADEWNEASFEDTPEQFELEYLLSTGGIAYIRDNVWNQFTESQKEKLKAFKEQINKISLDALLRYVYNKYPEDAKKSLIADKYLKKADE